MTQMLIPNWILRTKKVDNKFCKLNYKDTLDNKLGILPFLSLEELQEELKELGITSQPQYRKYRKENNKINWPSAPDEFYNITFNELFGKTKKEFLSLEKLQEKLKELGITTESQYLKYRKENNKINWPSAPDEFYNISWNELFEKTKISLEKLQEKLEELGITTKRQYLKYRKENNKINWPSQPDEFYNITFNELFGKTKKEFLSLEQLQEKLKELGITTEHQYRKYRKENNKINWPSAPNEFYNITLNELFEKTKISLEKLQEKLKEHNITSQPQYLKYRKENNKINWPSAPNKFYNISWNELFGK